jgi:hypothetical protein
MTALLIRNVRTGSGRERDALIADGRIARIGPVIAA